jgi:hypothetical protein
MAEVEHQECLYLLPAMGGPIFPAQLWWDGTVERTRDGVKR